MDPDPDEAVPDLPPDEGEPDPEGLFAEAAPVAACCPPGLLDVGDLLEAEDCPYVGSALGALPGHGW